MDKDLTHHILYVSHKTGHDQRITLTRGTKKLLKCSGFKASACLGLGEVCASVFKSLSAAHYVWNSLYLLLSTWVVCCYTPGPVCHIVTQIRDISFNLWQRGKNILTKKISKLKFLPGWNSNVNAESSGLIMRGRGPNGDNLGLISKNCVKMTIIWWPET